MHKTNPLIRRGIQCLDSTTSRTRSSSATDSSSDSHRQATYTLLRTRGSSCTRNTAEGYTRHAQVRLYPQRLGSASLLQPLFFVSYPFFLFLSICHHRHFPLCVKLCGCFLFCALFCDIAHLQSRFALFDSRGTSIVTTLLRYP